MLTRNDELNTLITDIEQLKGNPGQIKDKMLDFLILAFADGMHDVESQLNSTATFDVNRMEEVIYQPIDGMTVDDRVDQWIYLEDYEALKRLAESERQRIYNTSAYDTATELGATTKTWHCMMLPTSRDTHEYLNGMTKPMNEPFYTYNGDSAQHPGGFGIANEDINCLCTLTFSK